jgi:signal transduction histidine kinase
MSTMIEDLLTMARDGRDVEDPDRIDLDAAATEAWQAVETGGASLAADTGVTIRADGSRLANLFENLYRNAIEHGTAADGPPITVRVEPTPEGFAVADDGVGIPPDIRETVTESGYTTQGDNTGYGLAIVEEVASAHGWELAVTESDAGGARFEFAGVETGTQASGDASAAATESADGAASADTAADPNEPVDDEASRVEGGPSRPTGGE